MTPEEMSEEEMFCEDCGRKFKEGDMEFVDGKLVCKECSEKDIISIEMRCCDE